MSRIFKALIIFLATARLMRFLTTDTLGEWTIVGPMKRWAWRKEHRKSNADLSDAEINTFLEELMEQDEPVPTPPAASGWRSKLVHGFDCPFCSGFWMGLLVLVASTMIRVPLIGPLLKLAGVGLALNYVAAHLSSRIDV